MSSTEQILRGERRAIARQISGIENERPEARRVLAELYPHTGQADLIGLTGAAGTGKSTLVNELAKVYRRDNKTVAIISVDPTSPFTGGAILGDRIRMQDLAGDPEVLYFSAKLQRYLRRIQTCRYLNSSRLSKMGRLW